MAKKKPTRKKAPAKKAAAKDTQQLARKVLDQVVPQSAPNPDEGKNPAAVALGRLGGLVGGKARAESLSAKKRVEIARRAAQARWSNVKGDQDGAD